MGNRGPLSEEWKQKIRESTTGPKNHFYGKHHTEETKQKLSEIKTGERHPNYGKHHSKETINKMRCAASGNNNPFFGRHHSEDSKRRMSEHSNRFWKGKNLPEEMKQKLREANKGKYDGEKNPMFGKHHSEATKQRISKIHFGIPLSEEHKKKISENHGRPMLGKHHTKEAIKKIFNSFNPSGPELYLDFLLQNCFPDEWQYVGDGQKIIDGLCPDFINVNGKQQIIELFGKHWHTGDNLRFHQTEKGRKRIFSDHGYELLIIWDYELKDEKNVIQKIKDSFYNIQS